MQSAVDDKPNIMVWQDSIWTTRQQQQLQNLSLQPLTLKLPLLITHSLILSLTHLAGKVNIVADCMACKAHVSQLKHR
jgi:hypothetical protein